MARTSKTKRGKEGASNGARTYHHEAPDYSSELDGSRTTGGADYCWGKTNPELSSIETYHLSIWGGQHVDPERYLQFALASLDAKPILAQPPLHIKSC